MIDTLSLLNSEQKTFLGSLSRAEGDDPGIPLYVRQRDQFTFLPEINMATSANRGFEEEAPAGLYRGGAVIMVRYADGILVVPDDRFHWYKPFAGMAQFDEGSDLAAAGRRELIEEAFIYDLKKTKRFVPVGAEKAGRQCSLGFTVSEVVPCGEMLIRGYAVNEKNKAREAILEWDISQIDEPFSVSLEEDWWSKHYTGVSVYVLNQDGSLRGVFSGQQGLIELPKLDLHPTLKAELAL